MAIKSTEDLNVIGGAINRMKPERDTQLVGDGISGPPFTGTTLNSADKGASITLSGGDLTLAQAGGAWNSIRAVSSKTEGKHYFEVTCTDINASGYCGIGICTSAVAMSTYFPTHADGHAYYALSGHAWSSNATSAWGNSYTDADVIGVAVDLDNDVIYFAKNGTWQNSSDPTSGASKTGAHNDKHYTDGTSAYFPAIASYGATTSITVNFGDSLFTHTPPAGYVSGWSA